MKYIFILIIHNIVDSERNYEYINFSIIRVCMFFLYFWLSLYVGAEKIIQL